MITQHRIGPRHSCRIQGGARRTAQAKEGCTSIIEGCAREDTSAFMQLRERGQKAHKEVHERDADAAVEKAVATGSRALGSEPPHQWRASHAGCSRLQLHQQRQRSSRPPDDRTWGSAFMQVPNAVATSKSQAGWKESAQGSSKLSPRHSCKDPELDRSKRVGPRGMLEMVGRGKCTRIVEDVLQS